MDPKDWYRISNEDRISLVGVCGVLTGDGEKRCTDANRWDKKYCHNHRYYKNPKCVIRGCYSHSRSWKFGMCSTHLQKYNKKQRSTSSSSTFEKCMYCTKRAKKYKQCSKCFTKRNICKTCNREDSKPLITRGGVCKRCPIIQKHKCADAFCDKSKYPGYDYCKSCGELNGKNMCRECKKNIRSKNGVLCSECNNNK